VATLADDDVGVFEVTADRPALEFYSAMGFEVVGEATTDLGSGLRIRYRFSVKSQDSSSTFSLIVSGHDLGGGTCKRAQTVPNPFLGPDNGYGPEGRAGSNILWSG
jgi:hypothetical protein